MPWPLAIAAHLHVGGIEESFAGCVELVGIVDVHHERAIAIR